MKATKSLGNLGPSLHNWALTPCSIAAVLNTLSSRKVSAASSKLFPLLEEVLVHLCPLAREPALPRRWRSLHVTLQFRCFPAFTAHFCCCITALWTMWTTGVAPGNGLFFFFFSSPLSLRAADVMKCHFNQRKPSHKRPNIILFVHVLAVGALCTPLSGIVLKLVSLRCWFHHNNDPLEDNWKKLTHIIVYSGSN